MIDKRKELRSRTFNITDKDLLLDVFRQEERLEIGLHIWKLTRCFCEDFFFSCTRLTSRVNSKYQEAHFRDF